MRRKTIYPVALMVAVVALLVINMPLYASKMDDSSNHPQRIPMCSTPTSRGMILKSGLRMASSP